MGQYYFRTKEFGVTDKGIHLLRGGFNYETIAFAQIHKLEIRRGKELNNWFAILVIGLILFTPGIYFAISVINILVHGDISPYGARIAHFRLAQFSRYIMGAIRRTNFHCGKLSWKGRWTTLNY
jgi:hypothetical protein